MDKKRFISAAAAFAFVLCMAGCGEEEPPVQIVSDEEQLHIDVGEEIYLTAHTKKDETIRWSCEDGDVAVIEPSGNLAGTANGITVITAETESGFDHIGVVVGNGVKGTAVAVKPSGNGKTAAASKSKDFNASSRITNVSVSLNGQSEDETLLLGTDEEAYLDVNVTPADCDDPLYYESSDTSVAEVDQEGTVYPRSRGTAVITVTAPNGVDDTFKVFVR